METYSYEGVELTANVFRELLIELFDGKQFQRKGAIAAVVEHHKKNGGVIGKTDYTAVFKKASKLLENEGLKNVAYGTWRLNFKKRGTDFPPPPEKLVAKLSADKTIGTGKNAVYVYYYETYKRLAENEGRNVWECKIGRTDTDPLQRVFSQAGTSFPETPQLALVINCDDSGQLEVALHKVLAYQGKQHESAPGKEWFITSPDEVERLYSELLRA